MAGIDRPANRTLTVRLASSVTAEVIAVLRPAVGSGSSSELQGRTERVARAATTVTGHLDDRLVAAACVDIDGPLSRLAAIAVTPGERGRGWGRSLVAMMPSLLGIQDLTAETDGQAVGFYRALGFSVVSLGEVHPGVERFACHFRW